MSGLGLGFLGNLGLEISRVQSAGFNELTETLSLSYRPGLLKTSHLSNDDCNDIKTKA